MKHTTRTVLALILGSGILSWGVGPSRPALFAPCALAITTTLEYEDARETNTLAVLRAEIAAAQPADYANVSNRAVNAVLTSELGSLETDPIWNAEKSGYATRVELIQKFEVQSEVYDQKFIQINRDLAAKQDALRFDSLPTEGSRNVVTSNGIKIAIDDAKAAVAAAYKPKQTAKTSPAAATTEAYQFIDSISQDTNGVITATKKTMRKATTSAPGMVQLNDNIDSTRTDHAATANALRIVAENADAAIDAANAAGVAATDAEAKATAVATAATNYTDSVAAPIWSYVLGDTVWFAVTNYMRTISGVAPALQLWEVRDGATNLIYSSTEEITNLIGKAVAPLATTQALHEVQAALPSKAWSRYQSATGADNPEPATVTIVSTPVVQLTGGGEWQPHTLAAGGTVWTLESNGLTSIGGTTNGYLVIRNTITGEEVFSVEERSFIPSVPVVDSFTPKPGGNGFVFSVYADARPTLYTATNLTDRVKVAWDAEGDDPNVIVNSWTNNGDGTWTVDVSLVVPSTSYYAYVGVSESTESIISNKRAVSFDGGVYVDGAKWRLGTTTINGVRVITAEAMP